MSKTRFLPKIIVFKDKNLLKAKNPKMDNVPKTEKRPTYDFSLGNTGGWGGGVPSTRIVIGNFRVIKQLA